MTTLTGVLVIGAAIVCVGWTLTTLALSKNKPSALLYSARFSAAVIAMAAVVVSATFDMNIMSASQQSVAVATAAVVFLVSAGLCALLSAIIHHFKVRGDIIDCGVRRVSPADNRRR